MNLFALLLLFPSLSFAHKQFYKDSGSVRAWDNGDYFEKVQIERQWEVEERLIDLENEREDSIISAPIEPFKYEPAVTFDDEDSWQ